jgi:biopolymer transport protein ExbD
MPLKTHLAEEPVINMMPLIDIVFWLIVYFLLGTKFMQLEEHQIGLQIPQVAEAGALTAAPERKVVNVFRDGSISLDKDTVTLEQLRTRLAAGRGQYQDLGVLVRGDAQGQFQTIADVLNACKQAGIQELGIAVLPTPAGK